MRHGLRRQDRALFNNSVSTALTKRMAEENRFLITHASSEMRRLYENGGSARWLALCTDTAGQIVHFVGHYSAAPKELQVLMQPGRRILEAELGTNAPGCVLEEKRPIVVTRGEHFLLELKEFFCASAPIFDPGNMLVGVLDISGVDVRALPLASDLVSFAVRRIENSMVSAVQDCTLLRFHSDERLLGSPFEAVLAVDCNGMIRGSNRTARQLLSFKTDCVMGRSLDSVLEGGLDGFLRRMRDANGESIRVPSDGGSLSFLKVETGRGSAAATSTRPARASRARANTSSFICEDTSLRADCDKAVRILRSGLPVIVSGETGTGKEVIARAMHDAIRPQGPFVALNCAAIPEGLIEAELFGYADGAFTGARRGGASGKIEQAHAGTLLLDEIGDMSMTLQSRLLRVLQEQVVTRIGDGREIPVDLLVICATHRDLERLVEKGHFREDLYYRLNGYTLRVPPLRERGDLRAIVEGLFRHWSAAERTGSGLEAGERRITAVALDCLASSPWPGNIRQLEQLIRACWRYTQPVPRSM